MLKNSITCFQLCDANHVQDFDQSGDFVTAVEINWSAGWYYTSFDSESYGKMITGNVISKVLTGNTALARTQAM